MRICIINPFAGTEFFGRENLEAVAAPGTEFDMVDIGERYPLTNNQWLFFKHSCTGPTIDRAIEAECQGYDAIFISCNLDIGLYECRQMCTIPVTATLEAAALTAHMMGRRFSLLSVDDQNGQTQPAPIIDGMLPGFKMAEVMATLGAVGLPPVSRLGVYEQPPVEDLKKLQRSRDQSMPVWAEGERAPS